jgi:hypothetical protein
MNLFGAIFFALFAIIGLFNLINSFITGVPLPPVEGWQHAIAIFVIDTSLALWWLKEYDEQKKKHYEDT